MDERRFRRVLEETARTIHSFGEDEIFAALSVLAERFGWELTRRGDEQCHYELDSQRCQHHDGHGGPHECEDRDDINSGEVWPEPDKLTTADLHLIRDTFGVECAPGGRVIDMRRQWS